MKKPDYPSIGMVTSLLGWLAAFLVVAAAIAMIFGFGMALAGSEGSSRFMGVYAMCGGFGVLIGALVLQAFCDVARAIVNTALQTADLVEMLEERISKDA